MTDILIAIAVMIAVSLTAGLLTAKFLHTAKGQWTMLVLAMPVLSMVYFLLQRVLRWSPARF